MDNQIIEVPNVNEIAMPIRDYKFRIIGGTARLTQAKDVMYQLDVEFIFPDIVKVKEGDSILTVAIKGQKTQLLLINSYKNRVALQKFVTLMGLENMVTFDPDNMQNEIKVFTGLCFMAYTGSSPKNLTRDDYDENGKVVKVSVLGPDGKTLTQNQFQLWPNSVKYSVDPSEFPQEVAF